MEEEEEEEETRIGKKKRKRKKEKWDERKKEIDVGMNSPILLVKVEYRSDVQMVSSGHVLVKLIVYNKQPSS